MLKVIKLTATLYNWNIVENGVKHHKPTNDGAIMMFMLLSSCISYSSTKTQVKGKHYTKNRSPSG